LAVAWHDLLRREAADDGATMEALETAWPDSTPVASRTAQLHRISSRGRHGDMGPCCRLRGRREQSMWGRAKLTTTAGESHLVPRDRPGYELPVILRLVATLGA
jgi:hypothetical protein